VRWLRWGGFLFLLLIGFVGCSGERNAEESQSEPTEQSEEASEPSDSEEEKPGLAIPEPFNPKPKPAIPKPFVPPKPAVPEVKILQPSKDETVIRIPDKVLFDFDSSKLRSEAYPVLAEIAESLNNAEGYEAKSRGTRTPRAVTPTTCSCLESGPRRYERRWWIDTGCPRRF